MATFDENNKRKIRGLISANKFSTLTELLDLHHRKYLDSEDSQFVTSCIKAQEEKLLTTCHSILKEKKGFFLTKSQREKKALTLFDRYLSWFLLRTDTFSMDNQIGMTFDLKKYTILLSNQHALLEKKRQRLQSGKGWFLTKSRRRRAIHLLTRQLQKTFRAAVLLKQKDSTSTLVDSLLQETDEDRLHDPRSQRMFQLIRRAIAELKRPSRKDISLTVVEHLESLFRIPTATEKHFPSTLVTALDENILLKEILMLVEKSQRDKTENAFRTFMASFRQASIRKQLESYIKDPQATTQQPTVSLSLDRASEQTEEITAITISVTERQTEREQTRQMVQQFLPANSAIDTVVSSDTVVSRSHSKLIYYSGVMAADTGCGDSVDNFIRKLEIWARAASGEKKTVISFTQEAYVELSRYFRLLHTNSRIEEFSPEILPPGFELLITEEPVTQRDVFDFETAGEVRIDWRKDKASAENACRWTYFSDQKAYQRLAWHEKEKKHGYSYKPDLDSAFFCFYQESGKTWVVFRDRSQTLTYCLRDGIPLIALPLEGDYAPNETLGNASFRAALEESLKREVISQGGCHYILNYRQNLNVFSSSINDSWIPPLADATEDEKISLEAVLSNPQISESPLADRINQAAPLTQDYICFVLARVSKKSDIFNYTKLIFDLEDAFLKKGIGFPDIKCCIELEDPLLHTRYSAAQVLEAFARNLNQYAKILMAAENPTLQLELINSGELAAPIFYFAGCLHALKNGYSVVTDSMALEIGHHNKMVLKEDKVRGGYDWTVGREIPPLPIKISKDAFSKISLKKFEKMADPYGAIPVIKKSDILTQMKKVFYRVAVLHTADVSEALRFWDEKVALLPHEYSDETADDFSVFRESLAKYLSENYVDRIDLNVKELGPQEIAVRGEMISSTEKHRADPRLYDLEKAKLFLKQTLKLKEEDTLFTYFNDALAKMNVLARPYSEIRTIEGLNEEIKAHQAEPAALLAILREVVFRLFGEALYLEQSCAILFLIKGNQLAEMPTGEGKTRILAVAAILSYLLEPTRPIRVLTHTDAAAEVGLKDFTRLAELLGIQAGLLCPGDTEGNKEQAVSFASITTAITSDLLDEQDERFQNAPNIRLFIDEIDDIAIEQASRTVVEINTTDTAGSAGLPRDYTEVLTKIFLLVVREGKTLEEIRGSLSSQDCAAESYCQLPLSDEKLLTMWYQAALVAKDKIKEVDYTLYKNEVCIVNRTTGRRLTSAAIWANGIGQMVQIKEQLEDPNVRVCEYVNAKASSEILPYLKLFKHKSGISGTIGASDSQTVSHLRQVLAVEADDRELYFGRAEKPISPNSALFIPTGQEWPQVSVSSEETEASQIRNDYNKRLDFPPRYYKDEGSRNSALLEAVRAYQEQGLSVLIVLDSIKLCTRAHEWLSSDEAIDSLRISVFDDGGVEEPWRVPEEVALSNATRRGNITLTTTNRAVNFKEVNVVITLEHQCTRIENQINGRGARDCPGLTQKFCVLRNVSQPGPQQSSSTFFRQGLRASGTIADRDERGKVKHHFPELCGVDPKMQEADTLRKLGNPLG